MSTAHDLIEDAMRNVRIAECEPCNGIGETLDGPCEDCEQSGLIVTSELESAHD